MDQKNDDKPQEISIANKRIMLNLKSDSDKKAPDLQKEIDKLTEQISKQKSDIEFLRKAVCVLMNMFIFGLGNYLYTKKLRHAITFATCFYGFVAFAITAGTIDYQLMLIIFIPAFITFLVGQFFIISNQK